MKYLVSWTPRAGSSGAEAEADEKRSLQLFGKWSPPADATFHQFVSTLTGGGYAVVETDNPLSVAEGPAKFGAYFDFKVEPVVDIMEIIPLGQEAIDFHDSIS
jgi:hypothetical protein